MGGLCVLCIIQSYLVARTCDFVFLFDATTITGRKYSNKTYRLHIFFLNSITGITVRVGGGRGDSMNDVIQCNVNVTKTCVRRH